MRQDRVSGASEIEGKVFCHIRKFLDDNEKLFNACLSILKAYPSMSSIWQIANFSFLYKDRESMDEIFHKMKEANKRTIENGVDVIEEDSTILTYSRSSIVEGILKKCEDKKIKVICSESRPLYEGRKLAKEICKHVKVTLVADASIFHFIDKADFVLIGADAILEKGIVNKVGTSAIALYAKAMEKPVYVASSSYKTFPFVFIKEEKKEEIWKNAPHEINVKNFYFDFTPANLISYFISENGIKKEKPKFRQKIAKEILKIRKLLKRTDYTPLNEGWHFTFSSKLISHYNWLIYF